MGGKVPSQRLCRCRSFERRASDVHILYILLTLGVIYLSMPLFRRVAGATCTGVPLFGLTPWIRMHLAEGSTAARKVELKMKSAKRTCIALLMVWLLVAGNLAARALSGQQAADQTKTNTNASKPADKKRAEDAAPSKKNNSNNSASTAAPTAALPGGVPGNAPSSATAAARKTSPAKNAGMVWVNTESGVFHKPGTRWYGKTKQGKYMTEADAIRAGYKASVKN
jgi:hypothetical protein